MVRNFLGGRLAKGSDDAGGAGRARHHLMDACYGNNSPAFDRSIDVCVGRLRKKLHDDPRNPAIIRTVRNGGYIFSAKVARH